MTQTASNESTIDELLRKCALMVGLICFVLFFRSDYPQLDSQPAAIVSRVAASSFDDGAEHSIARHMRSSPNAAGSSLPATIDLPMHAHRRGYSESFCEQTRVRQSRDYN